LIIVAAENAARQRENAAEDDDGDVVRSTCIKLSIVRSNSTHCVNSAL